MQAVVAPSQGLGKQYLGRASLPTHFPIAVRSCISKLVATSITTTDGEIAWAVPYSTIFIDKAIWTLDVIASIAPVLHSNLSSDSSV